MVNTCVDLGAPPPRRPPEAHVLIESAVHRIQHRVTGYWLLELGATLIVARRSPECLEHLIDRSPHRTLVSHSWVEPWYRAGIGWARSRRGPAGAVGRW